MDPELSHFLKLFHLSEQYCKRSHDKAKKWYLNYRSYVEETENWWKSSIFDPITYMHTENVTARMMQSVFGATPIISVVGHEGADLTLAKQIEKVMNTIITDPDVEFFLESLDWFKLTAIYGTGFMMVAPKFKPDLTKTYDGIEFSATDFWDLYPDPRARRLSKARWVVHRRLFYFDELKELEKQGIYENVDEIKVSDIGGAYTDHGHLEVLKKIGFTGTYTGYDQKTKLYEVLDFLMDGHIVSIGARRTFIRDTRKNGKAPFPFPMPIADLRYTPVPLEFFGIGVPEELEALQERLNTQERQRLDNVNLVINKLFKVNYLADIDLDNLISAPGNIILTNDMNAIDELRISDVTSAAYQEEIQTKKSAMDVTGEWEYARGVTPEKRETATGIVRLQEAALLRFDIKRKIMEFAGVRALAKKIVLLIRRFMPQEEYERIVGGNDVGFYKLSESDIFKCYDVHCVGSSITPIKAERVQRLLSAQKILMGMPPQVGLQNIIPFVINYYELYKRSLQALDVMGIEDILVKNPPATTPPMPPAPSTVPPPGGAPEL